MSEPSSRARYRYLIYGVRIASDCAFEFPTVGDRERPLADVEFLEGTDTDFLDLHTAADADFICRTLADGSTYLRWAHLYEFRVAADGSLVVYRSLDGCDRAVLQNFLFGQVLGVALVQQ